MIKPEDMITGQRFLLFYKQAFPHKIIVGTICLLSIVFPGLVGCARCPEKLSIVNLSKSYKINSIISSELKKPVTFDMLMADLNTVRIIYVGEQHTNPADHTLQLKILKHLCALKPNLIVGMEMFDQTYQPILDQWSSGALSTQAFIEKTQWYANWKFDFDLYRQLLDYIRQKRIPLIALNIPSYIPSRIAVGGIENLLPEDKKFLPKTINTSNPSYRDYIRKIFKQHHIEGIDNFDYFYEAQCVWDDVMAQSIAEHLNKNTMIVFAGNGHITHDFGIPERAYALTNASFRTVMPINEGSEADLTVADYLWVTPP